MVSIKLKKAKNIIIANKGQIILPALAAQMNAKRIDALETLKRLIQMYNCTLKVTDDGTLIYDFGKNFNTRSSHRLGQYIHYIVMAWHFLMLGISYMIWSVMNIVLAYASQDDFVPCEENEKGRCRKVDILDRLSPHALRVTKVRPPSNDRISELPSQDRLRTKIMNLELMTRSHKTRKKEFMAYVNKVGGIVTAMDWAILFNTDLQTAEDEITALYAEYSADIKVAEFGELVFDFSADLGKAYKATVPRPRFYDLSLLRKLTPNTSGVLLYGLTTVMMLLIIYDLAVLTPYLGLYIWHFPSQLNWLKAILHPLLISSITTPPDVMIMSIQAFLFMILFGVFVPVTVIFVLTFPLDLLLALAFYAFVSKQTFTLIYSGPTVVLMFLLSGLAILAFPLFIARMFLLLRLVRNKDLWFTASLHEYLMRTQDGGIPPNGKDAADFLSNTLDHEVPEPSGRGFTRIMAGLQADLASPDDPDQLDKPAIFVFPRIRAQQMIVSQTKTIVKQDKKSKKGKKR